MARRARAAACVAALVAGGVGCGGDDGVGLLPRIESARFAGTQGSLGVFVDFRADDATTRVLTSVLARTEGPWSIGVASVVNRSDQALEIPSFVASLPDRRRVSVDRADRSPVAAAAKLPNAGGVVPPNSAKRVYLVVRQPVQDIRQVHIRVGTGAVTMLSPREADPTAPGAG